MLCLEYKKDRLGDKKTANKFEYGDKPEMSVLDRP